MNLSTTNHSRWLLNHLWFSSVVMRIEIVVNGIWNFEDHLIRTSENRRIHKEKRTETPFG